MRILGIETSFDDTCIAIYDDKLGILANEIRHQSYIHNQYGGVVPELAAREHVNNIFQLLKYIINKTDILLNTIDAIAYTAGPGLPGSLLVGASLGCALAYSCNIPCIPIHHMEGHLLSVMLESNPPKFPFVALLISGKHTQLINAVQFGEYHLLGETLDDAIGEVFDKVAKALNLGYPGGPILSSFSNKGQLGDFNFPKPMKYSNNFNFSFSGLKTFTINLILQYQHNTQKLSNIALGFEDAAIEVLAFKSYKALNHMNYSRLIVAGGVSANTKLINRFKSMLLPHKKQLYYVCPKLCTDNAAMIAYVGMLYFKKGFYSNCNDIIIHPKWSINSLYS